MIEKVSDKSPFVNNREIDIGRYIDFHALENPLNMGKWFAFEDLHLGDALEDSFLRGCDKVNFYLYSIDMRDGTWLYSLDSYKEMMIAKDNLEYGKSVIWWKGEGCIIAGFSDWVLASESCVLKNIFFNGSVEETFLNSDSIFNGQELYLDDDSRKVMERLVATW